MSAVKFDVATFLPLVAKLGEYVKIAFDHVVTARQLGSEVTPDLVAALLGVQMANWNPEVRGKKLLDPETKEAAARFLAGVAFNLVGKEKQP